MNRTRIVVSGGAGFVDSTIAMAPKRDLGDAGMAACHNLKDSGSSEPTLECQQAGERRSPHARMVAWGAIGERA